MEDEVYPEIGDAKNYLVDYMDAPDLCPLSVGRDEFDVHWYGGWILLRYISEHYGGPSTIRQLWERMASMDGLQALETTLTEQGTTLDEVLVNFAIANLTKSNCPENIPYCYAQGNDYFRPYVESIIRVDVGEVDTFIPKDGVQQLGTDYVRLKSKGPILVDFQGSSAGRWAVRLVGLAGGQTRVTSLADSGPTTVNPLEFDRLYLVIVNTQPVDFEADCGYHNYTLALADATIGQAIKAPLVPQDPGLYVPSTYNGDSTYLLGEGTPIEAKDAPFDLLYPRYLPRGYSFMQMVSYTLADLADFKQDYAPGGEPIIGLEYIGPKPETYVFVTQSVNPYESITDWVNERGYLENDVRLINNKPVYLVDYRDNAAPFSSATFIHHGLFIVIDGTFDSIEMQHVVADFVANNP